MKLRRICFVCATCVACASCGSSDNVPAPYPVVAASSADAEACAHLRVLTCSDGSPKRGTCEDAFVQARTLKEPGIDSVAPCVIACKDLTCVRACGGPGTLTFPCRVTDGGT